MRRLRIIPKTLLEEPGRSRYRKDTSGVYAMKLLRGWEEIRDGWGLSCSTQTVRRLARKYNLPVVYMNCRPTITDTMISLWLLAVQKTVLEAEKEGQVDSL